MRDDCVAAVAAGVTREAMVDDASSATTEVESVDETAEVESAASECLPAIVPSKVKRKVLILFSGRLGTSGSLESCLRKFGLDVEAFDVLNGSQYDLTDDSIWEPLHRRITAGGFAAVIVSPPCGTFSRLRSIPGGPPPLRGLSGKDRYGLAGLDKRRAEQVRLANILALRGIQAAVSMHRCGGAAIIEQPALTEGEVSMLRLDEFVELLNLPGVVHSVIAQCPFGALSQKLSSFVAARVSFMDAPACCTHKPRQWFKECTAEVVASRHPPTRGTDKYYSSREEALRATRSSAGDYVSSTLAAYPPLFNRYLAAKLRMAISTCKVAPVAASAPGTSGQIGWVKKRSSLAYH